MRVGLFAGKDRKQKGQIGVIRVEQIHLPQIESTVAGCGGEVSVELVVGLGALVKIPVNSATSGSSSACD